MRDRLWLPWATPAVGFSDRDMSPEYGIDSYDEASRAIRTISRETAAHSHHSVDEVEQSIYRLIGWLCS